MIAQGNPQAKIRSGPHTVSFRLVKTIIARSKPSTPNGTRQAAGGCLVMNHKCVAHPGPA
eukprot:1211600-Prymnesium_polylepis.1